jgi:predicted metal-dependent phosphotriesterase family hydrolase
MAFIRTIHGDINAKEMGVTNTHEHLIRIGGGEVALHGEDMRLPFVDKAVEEVKRFQAAGGKTIVDCNPIGVGRDIVKLLEVNEQVPDVNLIVTTGFHYSQVYDRTVHWVVRYSVEEIADLLIAEIEEGIDEHDYMGPIVKRSKAKAGCIKVGTSYGMITPFEEKEIKAAAIAAKETGAVINTHTTHGTMALEQVQWFLKLGVNPEQILIGHVQRIPDAWYHKKIAALGASFSYDGGYRIKYWPDRFRVELIQEMIKAGYQKHITLSTDSGKKSYQKAYGAGTGVDYDLVEFVPRLREEGVSESALEDILVNNPARLFTLKK